MHQKHEHVCNMRWLDGVEGGNVKAMKYLKPTNMKKSGAPLVSCTRNMRWPDAVAIEGGNLGQ